MKLRAAASLALFFALPSPTVRAGELSVSEFMDKLPVLLEHTPEPPKVTESQIDEMEEGDVETFIFLKDALAHPPRPVNLGGDGRLALVRPDTGESAVSFYRNRDGSYDYKEIERINKVLRCSRTRKTAEITPKLVEILDAVQDHFGSRWLTVLSGYRTPRYNREVPGAARRSLHMLGWAADVRVPGKDPAEVAEFARSLGAGGVGYYRQAAFVHLDAGRRRGWDAPEGPAAVKKPAPSTRP